MDLYTQWGYPLATPQLTFSHCFHPEHTEGKAWIKSKLAQIYRAQYSLIHLLRISWVHGPHLPYYGSLFCLLSDQCIAQISWRNLLAPIFCFIFLHDREYLEGLERFFRTNYDMLYFIQKSLVTKSLFLWL